MKKSINFKENNNVRRNECLDIYMSEMNRHKQLSDAELRDLITLAQNGNRRAREKAITANLRIVWSIAASYNGMDNLATSCRTETSAFAWLLIHLTVSEKPCFQHGHSNRFVSTLQLV